MAQQKTASREHHYSFAGLTLLIAPVPSMLEKAIGYTGEARFVSFYWMPGGDETYYDDGQRGGTGNWQGYLAYIQHATVYPLLTQYHFGGSESEAQHALILDREERRCLVASIKDTRNFLAQQWPKLEPIRVTKEEWAAVTTELKRIKQSETIDMKEVYKRIKEQTALVEELQNWLDRLLPN